MLLLDDIDESNDVLWIIDKSQSAWVNDFIIDKTRNLDRVNVIRVQSEVGLLESIKRWALQLNFKDDDFIQVYAEDDLFLRNGQIREIENYSVLMYITPIIFLYDKNIICESQIDFNGLIDSDKIREVFKYGQTVGDSSWHALIKADIFVLYIRWIDSLPVVLWNASNQAIWTALYFGKISRLHSFVFVKDSESWAQGGKSRDKMMMQYQNIFGDPFLYIYDQRLYFLGCMANLFWLDLSHNRGIDNNLFKILLKLICKRPGIRNASLFMRGGYYWKYWFNYLSVNLLLFFDAALNKFGLSLINKNSVAKIFKEELSSMPKIFDGLTGYYLQICGSWLRK